MSSKQASERRPDLKIGVLYNRGTSAEWLSQRVFVCVPEIPPEHLAFGKNEEIDRNANTYQVAQLFFVFGITAAPITLDCCGRFRSLEH